MDCFLDKFRNSLIAITNLRYFSSERAYQGALIAELQNKVNIKEIFSSNAIVEQEYQKTLEAHGINIRPDLIIHVPFDGINNNRASDNYVVIQLKLKASEKKAEKDFDDLDSMFEKLNYRMGIFLNINSTKTFFDHYQGKYKEQIHCFAVKLIDSEVKIYEQ
jgi:hypothetical protein